MGAVELQLVRSGLSITPNQLILGQVALGSILFLVGRYVLFESQGSLALLLAIAMATPAVILPRFVLKYLERSRVTKFENQLAQGVDVMAGALQAGSSLPQSFEMVRREMPPPIGEEFEPDDAGGAVRRLRWTRRSTTCTIGCRAWTSRCWSRRSTSSIGLAAT